MIPGHVKDILEPIAKWIFSIGILGSIHMQAQINTNKQITKIAELVFFIAEDQESYKNKGQCVFKKPVSSVSSADK